MDTQPSGNPYDLSDLWPPDVGWDDAPGLLTLDRAMRARDRLFPEMFDESVADEVIDGLLARVDGRRTPSRS